MPKSTIKEAIIAALKREGKPMSIKDIYDKIIEWDFYRFKAERPVGIVAVEIRRHCAGVNFPTAHREKYYQILTDGTYWLLEEPIPTSQNAVKVIVEKTTSKGEAMNVDNLRQQHSEYIQEFKSVVLAQLKEIDPQVFESFSKKLLEVYGFKELSVTQFSKDGGIDGHGKLKIGISYLDVAFQSKRWKSTTVPKK